MTDKDNKQSGNMPETPVKIGYLKKGKYRPTPKQKSVIRQVNNGVDLKTAILSAGYQPQGVSMLKRKFAKYLDSHPKMVRKSKQVREAILDRALNGDTDYIAAAERVSTRVQDSVDPIVKVSQNLNINADVSVFDLMQYRNKDIQDVVNDNNPDGQ